jgi:hypothetical protein
MEALLSLVFVAVFPLALFGFLMWLTYLEDTLPRAVSRAGRQPDPAPILRIPVQRPPQASGMPAQRIPSAGTRTAEPQPTAHRVSSL